MNELKGMERRKEVKWQIDEIDRKINDYENKREKIVVFGLETEKFQDERIQNIECEIKRLTQEKDALADAYKKSQNLNFKTKDYKREIALEIPEEMRPSFTTKIKGVRGFVFYLSKFVNTNAVALILISILSILFQSVNVLKIGVLLAGVTDVAMLSYAFIRERRLKKLDKFIKENDISNLLLEAISKNSSKLRSAKGFYDALIYSSNSSEENLSNLEEIEKVISKLKQDRKPLVEELVKLDEAIGKAMGEEVEKPILSSDKPKKKINKRNPL